MSSQESRSELERLNQDFFTHQHSADPFTATILGVSGFDHLVPDPSRAGSVKSVHGFRELEDRITRFESYELDEAERVNLQVMRSLSIGARTDLENGLWEANASAAGYVSPQALVFQAVPNAVLDTKDSVDGYLARLERLPGYLKDVGERYLVATSEGRISTRVGVIQAIDHLEGHLSLGLDSDTMINVELPAGTDVENTRQAVVDTVTQTVWPALRKLRDTLRGLLNTARSDSEVGICNVPKGVEGYRYALARNTTTSLTPDEIHDLGHTVLEELRSEWEMLGKRVLGTSDMNEIFKQLRDNPALRFDTSKEIVDTVAKALERAESTKKDWFPLYEIRDCTVEEINPVESSNAALAHYRPPSADGTRPGAHCVLTSSPQLRFRFEYEALAFHESTPGHHLQIASAQTLASLPAFRRYLDTEVCAYVEGWGLYAERLADEMGLYTSDLSRLGMLSFDALRACRLVVDTGMHYHNWSRQRAMDFMWENCATPMANIENEITRYIAWPGQATAYMIGKREIMRLRSLAMDSLGDSFSYTDFHGVVLGNGAIPLSVLDSTVRAWISDQNRP